MINVQVDKNGSENSISLIRRFTKRVQGSGVLPRVRSIRYHARTLSKLLKKKKTLKSIANRAKYQELIKLGKITDKPYRFKRRRR